MSNHINYVCYSELPKDFLINICRYQLLLINEMYEEIFMCIRTRFCRYLTYDKSKKFKSSIKISRNLFNIEPKQKIYTVLLINNVNKFKYKSRK